MVSKFCRKSRMDDLHQRLIPNSQQKIQYKEYCDISFSTVAPAILFGIVPTTHYLRECTPKRTAQVKSAH